MRSGFNAASSSLCVGVLLSGCHRLGPFFALLLLLLAATFVLMGTSVEAGLVHRWDMDEAAGTNLSDLAGSCDGTIHGTLQRPGDAPPQTTLPGGVTVAPEQFLRFDGLDSNYVDFGYDNSLSPGHLSVAFWIRAPGDPDDPDYLDADYSGRVILSKHGGQTCPSSWEFGFSPDEGDAARLQFVSWGGSGKVHTRSNRFTAADFKDGQWHHVVGTCDGAVARLYIDGALLEMSTQTGSIEVSPDFPLYMGRRSFESIPPDAWAFPGDVGGPFLIYDHALSNTEIAAVVDYNPPPPSRELLGRWDPGDDINLGHDPLFNTREMTVAVWAKAAGDHGGQVLLAKQSDSKSSFELGFDERWGGQPYGELYFKVHVGSSKEEGADSSSVMAGSTIYGTFDAFDADDFNDGKWHFFVGTHDGENTSLYVDGNLIDNPLNRGFVNDTGELADLLIGDTDAGDPFSGLIGGPFLFYDYAMSPQAVMAMYHLLPGDANLDGCVDETDAAALISNWQLQSGADWTKGDFNDDGRIDDADATILAANWQQTTAANCSVPEPSAFAILACLAAFAVVLMSCAATSTHGVQKFVSLFGLRT